MKKTVLGLSPGLLMAIVFISGIVPIVLLAAPAIAAQFSSQLGLAPGQIGLLFGAENAAMSLASIPAFFWQKRWNWRRVGLAAAICFILANIASYFAMAFQPLLLLRLVSGIGGGTLMVMCLSSAALSPQKDRVYGLWVCGQLVVGAVALWILPILFSHFGLGAFYLALALLLALCLPLISYFPGMIEQPAPGATKPAKGKRDYLALAGILAILAFYIGLSGVWSFMGIVAQGAGIDPEATGRVLAMASIVGIFGSLAVALFGGRIPRGLSLLIGYSVLTLSIIGLLGVPGVLRFGMAAFAFKLIWTSLLPLILGVVAERDRDGRLMGSVNLCIGAGLTIGPATAGQLIQSTGNMTIVLWGSAALLQLSFLFILMCRRTGSGALQTAIKPAT